MAFYDYRFIQLRLHSAQNLSEVPAKELKRQEVYADFEYLKSTVLDSEDVKAGQILNTLLHEAGA